jgi:hypothetical protein
VFDQMREVYHQWKTCNPRSNSLQTRGRISALAFASAPSVAQFIAARAIDGAPRYPDLFIDLNILKIEETLDYLLLERGEFVIMSSPSRTRRWNAPNWRRGASS